MKFVVVLILSIFIYKLTAESNFELSPIVRQKVIHYLMEFEKTYPNSNNSQYFNELIQSMASCATRNECEKTIHNLLTYFKNKQNEYDSITTTTKKSATIKKPFKWG